MSDKKFGGGRHDKTLSWDDAKRITKGHLISLSHTHTNASLSYSAHKHMHFLPVMHLNVHLSHITRYFFMFGLGKHGQSSYLPPHSLKLRCKTFFVCTWVAVMGDGEARTHPSLLHFLPFLVTVPTRVRMCSYYVLSLDGGVVFQKKKFLSYLSTSSPCQKYVGKNIFIAKHTVIYSIHSDVRVQCVRISRYRNWQAFLTSAEISV